MKNHKLPYFVLIFINLAVALSCFFYPVSRDEFYYLYLIDVPDPFAEFVQSYHQGNPRIGQFFCNIISRNMVLEVIFGVVLFNAFISALYLNIYRKLPNFYQVQDVIRFLKISAFFILFINYFGEMFYYTPFSSNYTFTHVFYLLYVFILSEYYLQENTNLNKKIPLVFFLFGGIGIGMANEHVPPVLVGISMLGAFVYFLKNKTLPNLKMVVLPILTIFGYAILYFAPANKIKQNVVGKTVLDTGVLDYLANCMQIIKIYFYYNKELVFIAASVLIALIIWQKLLKKFLLPKREIIFWALLFFLPLLIVGVSPLLGPRLLFFSNSVLLIVLYKIIIHLVQLKKLKVSAIFAYVFLLLFSVMSVVMTYRADENFKEVIAEIEIKSKETEDVVLNNQFNYFTLNIGTYLQRKIFLESGVEYIDEEASRDTSVEHNLKNLYHLKNLKEK